MRLINLFVFLGVVNMVAAQQQVTVKLTTNARDDRFDRLSINLALFEVKNDTILSWDFEGLRKAVPLLITKPQGFKLYAYGYLFFAGNTTGYNPGLITILVANPYDKHPKLFLDLNNNLNFTDDGNAVDLPWMGEHKLLNFCMPNSQQCASVKLSRHPYNNKYEYKMLMNEFYTLTYPDRKFMGMEYCYRQQVYQTKAGILADGKDSFYVALYDGNQNGIYNEADSDKFVIANISDTVFYPFDELYASTISNKAGKCFVDKNGKQYELVSASPYGTELTLNILNQASTEGQTRKGKKLPKFKYITWKGESKKITKLRKYQLYIYYGSPQSANFSEDTAVLRIIAQDYVNQVKVIGFIEVNKSYELSIFGQYSYLNWILAYKDKYLNKRLGIRGIPNSIYTAKRRKVIGYNMTPKQLLQQLQNQPAKP